MKVLNFGSLNIDFVYQVDHIVCPGETISSSCVGSYPGGKGLNQSIALSRAGINVYHAGFIGADGIWLENLLQENGVNTEFVTQLSVPTGSAFIQVDSSGQNSIVLYGGANQGNSISLCDTVLSRFTAGDVLLLQNEVNCIEYLITTAHEKGITVVLNPSPLDNMLLSCNLSLVDLFIMNLHEGMALTGEKDADSVIEKAHTLFPNANVVVTLGSKGAIALFEGRKIYQHAYPVEAVDTTGAGDTFTGFFLATLVSGQSVEFSLDIASKAAAKSVAHKGAAVSIPYLAELS